MFHVLAFDRKGGVWRRAGHSGDDVAERVRVEGLLREQMVMNPGRFRVSVPTGAKAAGPAVTVEWESAVRSVGVAYTSLSRGERAAAYLLMAGVEEVAEETTIRALETVLGVTPGHPLWPAFATVRRARRRPLLAAFRVGEPLDGNEERALLAVEWALGRTYFGMFGAHEGEGMSRWENATTKETFRHP